MTGSTASWSPLVASQMRAVRSLDDVTIRRPSGEKATLRTTTLVTAESDNQFARVGIPDAAVWPSEAKAEAKADEIAIRFPSGEYTASPT